MKTDIFRTLTLLLGLAPAACGVTYTSPRVSNQLDSVAVREVDLTAQTVLVANRTAPYTPRTLPLAFYDTAGTGTATRQLTALPNRPEVPQLEPQPLELNPPPKVTPPPYRLGIGDTVALVRAAPSQGAVREEYTVRSDGTISLPDIGGVQVANRSLRDAEAALFDAFVARQVDPGFSLELTGYNSKRVAVGGLVAAPQNVPVTVVPLTLSQAIAAAGGLTTRDHDYGTIRIYRTGDLYQIPMKDYLDRPDLRRLNLLNGDAVHVDTSYDLDRALGFYRDQIDVISLNRHARADALTELDLAVGLRRDELIESRANFTTRAELGAEQRDYVYLGGEFRNNARMPLPYGQHLNLADALFGQGGFSTRTADASHIYVLRSSPNPEEFGAVTAWHLDARNPAALSVAARMQLRPNDIVFIQEQPITTWGRALDQFLPSLVNAGLDAANG
ncbi:polysaccharide biosynthesis/export family protein [Ruegeria sp.]|uniref:polysaccharide biosynthesis/export family protein n=1 Tax=Ruegeria sp. TaxID=1879320 RepID=UPI00230A854D|nr:polysaccharide biosynthesis/export family protein [Ruegeria sp.]MDA7963545.1 polysaccharide biosynthesis/export family protein [Ruegeria sp.]